MSEPTIFTGLAFPFACSIDALLAVPPMLPDEGALMTLWRADAKSVRRVVTEHHVGLDLRPKHAESGSLRYDRLYCNPKEWPA